jgi:hypothetical protein
MHCEEHYIGGVGICYQYGGIPEALICDHKYATTGNLQICYRK